MLQSHIAKELRKRSTLKKNLMEMLCQGKIIFVSFNFNLTSVLGYFFIIFRMNLI